MCRIPEPRVDADVPFRPKDEEIVRAGHEEAAGELGRGAIAVEKVDHGQLIHVRLSQIAVGRERLGISSIDPLGDGDVIDIDIPDRKLNVKLSDQEIKKRLKDRKIPERKLTPLLESYREKFAGINCYGR